MARLRIIGLTLLALAVPTVAFGGEEAPSGPQSLSVSASLGSCGLANAAIVCQIDASWNALEGADYYTVSVTRPDGSVLDLGQAAGTSRTLFVSYVGSGSYSVQVAAWGTPPGEDEPEVLARENALSAGDGRRDRAVASEPEGSGPAGEGRSTDASTASGAPEGDDEVVATPTVELPECAEEPEDEGEPTAEEVTEAAGAAAAAENLAADVAAEGLADDVPALCP